jgi:cytochrome c oxidase subunit 3
MTQSAATGTGEALPLAPGIEGVVADWSSDQRAFKKVPWGKAMMWIFLLSDTFIFSSFLISYMTVRMGTTAAWPNPSEVFALTIAGKSIPLILIAIMTFVLISSSGTMVLGRQLRLQEGPSPYRHLSVAHRGAGRHVCRDAGVRVDQADPGGRTSLGQSVRRGAVRLVLFMITGFHGTHVSIGVIFLIIVAIKVLRGDLDNEKPGFMTGRKGNYEIVETMGLYWHFVDLVWVFIFAFFYLW